MNPENRVWYISGVLSNTSTVLNAPAGMLSLPLGLSGNITQLVPAGIKSHGQLRASSSMPVFQVFIDIDILINLYLLFPKIECSKVR